MQLFHKKNKKSCFFFFVNYSSYCRSSSLLFSPQHAIWAFRFDAIEMSTFQSPRDKFFNFFFLKKNFLSELMWVVWAVKGLCSKWSVMSMKMKFHLQYQAKDSTVPPVVKTRVAPIASSTNCTYILRYFFTCRFRFVPHFSLLWNRKLTSGDIVCVFF